MYYFNHQLFNSTDQDALDYLLKRGLKKDIINDQLANLDYMYEELKYLVPKNKMARAKNVQLQHILYKPQIMRSIQLS